MIGKKLHVLADEDPDASDLPLTKKTKKKGAALEKLYETTSAKIIQERSDFLLPQIVDMVKSKKWMNLRPEYQRRIRWDNKKKSLLIESLLMNIPIPPVFLYEHELSRYEVMDGQQRLSSIVDFYNDELTLQGLHIWSDLNGLKYSQCPIGIRRGLDRRRISSVVLLAESSTTIGSKASDIRLQVFGRLNTGGTALNPQELRNSVFMGEFNDLIVRLAKLPRFTEMWGIPDYAKNTDKHGAPNSHLRDNKLFSTMADCQIVLRFFAFRDDKKIVGSVRKMLDQCMQDNSGIDQNAVSNYEKEFSTRLDFVYNLLGRDAFRLPIDKGGLSRPLFDALMVAVDSVWAERAKILNAKSNIRNGFPGIFKNKKTYQLVVGKPNTALAVKRRIAAIRKYLLSNI